VAEATGAPGQEGQETIPPSERAVEIKGDQRPKHGFALARRV